MKLGKNIVPLQDIATPHLLITDYQQKQHGACANILGISDIYLWHVK
jgi:hypothetical protein